MTRRICEVSLQSSACKAPAAYGGSGMGIAEGDGSCRGTCTFCDKPCCRACSKLTKGKRRCNDCAGEYQQVSSREGC